MVRPCLRTRNPMPPPRVIPPSPTEPVSPKPVARPWTAVGRRVLGGGQPGVGPGGPSVDVDLEFLHVAQVEHDPVVDDGMAGEAVAAAADGEGEARDARERDHVRDVVGAGRPHDDQRSAIDPTGHDRPGRVVLGAVRPDQRAAEGCLQVGHRQGWGGRRGHALAPSFRWAREGSVVRRGVSSRSVAMRNMRFGWIHNRHLWMPRGPDQA